MKRPTSPWKVVALVTSITLAGAYVGYRAVGARPGDASLPPRPTPAAPPTDPSEMLGGSKSEPIIFFNPGPTDRPYLGGSKSLAPFISPEDVQKAKQKDPPK